MARTYRLRDPVHGLIVFDAGRPLDQLAWALLNTPEFQRLRRIKQLGVSEFVFPGATHTRFAHCIGVFHTARMLVGVIEREHGAIGAPTDPYRKIVAVVAALLHDIGHGPFSHAFEHAYLAVLKSRHPEAVEKSHETWTSEIILHPDGGVRPLLDAHAAECLDGRPLALEVADLLTRENPADIYHAIVSSSFDADRLDYLRRDRLMSGSGAGAIDFDWLLDNLTVADIDPAGDEGEFPSGPTTPSFCLRARALQAAEAFVIARYHLYTQVYLHKTTRCVEAMIGALLSRFAELCAADRTVEAGIDGDHALARFFRPGGDTLSGYLPLDDTVVWAAVGAMRGAADPFLADLAGRILDRNLYKVLDCDSAFMDNEERRRVIKRVQIAKGQGQLFDILEDAPRLSAYGEGGADESKAHNRLMILDASGHPREITDVSPVVGALESKRLNRFFFRSAAMRDKYKNRRV